MQSETQITYQYCCFIEEEMVFLLIANIINRAFHLLGG